MNVTPAQFSRVKAEKEAERDIKAPAPSLRPPLITNDTLDRVPLWLGGRRTPDIMADASPYIDRKPGVAPKSPSLFISAYSRDEGKRVFQVHGDCASCMSAARDFYDDQHTAHVANYLELKLYGGKDGPA